MWNIGVKPTAMVRSRPVQTSEMGKPMAILMVAVQSPQSAGQVEHVSSSSQLSSPQTQHRKRNLFIHGSILGNSIRHYIEFTAVTGHSDHLIHGLLPSFFTSFHWQDLSFRFHKCSSLKSTVSLLSASTNTHGNEIYFPTTLCLRVVLFSHWIFQRLSYNSYQKQPRLIKCLSK